MTLLSIILLVAAFFAATVSGYIVEIPAKNQECFFENLTKYERMISSFEVLAGGMLDINIKVLGPDGKVVYESERETEGAFQFAAQEGGLYQVCFNSMSTLTSKVVSFNIYAGHDLHKYQGAKASHMEPLDRALAGLTESVRKFVDGYHYLRARIITCQSTTESTNDRVFWWGLGNFAVILSAFLIKIYLIRRPFESRK